MRAGRWEAADDGHVLLKFKPAATGAERAHVLSQVDGAIEES